MQAPPLLLLLHLCLVSVALGRPLAPTAELVEPFEGLPLVQAFADPPSTCTCTDTPPQGQSCERLRDSGAWCVGAVVRALCGARHCGRRRCRHRCHLEAPPPPLPPAAATAPRTRPPCAALHPKLPASPDPAPNAPCSAARRSFATWTIAQQLCETTCGRCVCPGQCQCSDVPVTGDFSCAQQVGRGTGLFGLQGSWRRRAKASHGPSRCRSANDQNPRQAHMCMRMYCMCMCTRICIRILLLL